MGYAKCSALVLKNRKEILDSSCLKIHWLHFSGCYEICSSVSSWSKEYHLIKLQNSEYFLVKYFLVRRSLHLGIQHFQCVSVKQYTCRKRNKKAPMHVILIKKYFIKGNYNNLENNIGLTLKCCAAVEEFDSPPSPDPPQDGPPQHPQAETGTSDRTHGGPRTHQSTEHYHWHAWEREVPLWRWEEATCICHRGNSTVVL